MQQASDYILVANRLYLHQLSLDGNRVQTLVSGLSFAVAVDFDFRFSDIFNNKYLISLCLLNNGRQGYLFWTDTTQRSIMRSNLDGSNIAILLDQGLMQPGTIRNHLLLTCFQLTVNAKLLLL